jgi:hypothetical protein
MAESAVGVNGRKLPVLSREQVTALRTDALRTHARNLQDALGISVAIPQHYQELVEWVMERQAQLAGPPSEPERFSADRQSVVVKGIAILAESQLRKLRQDAVIRMARDIKDVLGVQEPVPLQFESVVEFILDTQKKLIDTVGADAPRQGESMRSFEILSREQLQRMRPEALVRLSRHLHDAHGLGQEDHPPKHPHSLVEWVLEKQDMLDKDRIIGEKTTGGIFQRHPL